MLNPQNTNLVVQSQSSQVDRYRYRTRGDANPINAANDLNLVEQEWVNRLKKSIQDDAERTNNWSLLWKTEAVYEAMDEEMLQLLLKMLGDGISAADFGKKVDTVCGSRAELTLLLKYYSSGNDKKELWKPLEEFFNPESKVCRQFQEEMSKIYKRASQRPPPTPPPFSNFGSNRPPPPRPPPSYG